MSLTTAGDALALETLIDRVGLYETLSMIEGICAAKADHIRTNWQDEARARAWDKAGAGICDVSQSVAL